jgi:glycosyltransferase involved in cell wall biosynthesis
VRILFVSNLYPPVVMGGYEVLGHTFATHLRARGNEVFVLTTRRGRVRTARGDRHVLRTLALQARPGTAATPTSPLSHLRTRLADVENAILLASAVRRTKPEAVVFLNCGYLGRKLIFSAQARVPVTLFYVADWWLLDLVKSERGRLSSVSRSRGLLEAALGTGRQPILPETVIFCGSRLAQQYRECLGWQAPQLVVPPPLDTALFAPLTGPAPRRSPLSVLYVGRISARKGVITLLRGFALARSSDELQSAALTLVGPWESKRIRDDAVALIGQLGLNDHVHIKGPLRRSLLPRIYRDHDVLVFPSEWPEPFGLVPLEAMACGTAVLTTTVGGILDWAVPDINCRTFTAGDPDSLAHELQWLWTHPGERNKMAQSARSFAISNFDPSARAEDLESIIARAAGTKPGRHATNAPRAGRGFGRRNRATRRFRFRRF